MHTTTKPGGAIRTALLALGAATLLGGLLAPAAGADPGVGKGGGAPAASSSGEDVDGNDGGTPDGVVDGGDDAHPSGKDRSVEHGGSGDQGKAVGDPDDDGRGPERTNGGRDQADGPGGADLADQDGNNGCGNDDDFEDDNEGRCRPRATEDACPAMPGLQRDGRSCTPGGGGGGGGTPADVCPDLAGHQAEVPPGTVKDASGRCVAANGGGNGGNGGGQPADVCPDLAGHQAEVPAGSTKDASGRCVAVGGAGARPAEAPAAPSTEVLGVVITRPPGAAPAVVSTRAVGVVRPLTPRVLAERLAGGSVDVAGTGTEVLGVQVTREGRLATTGSDLLGGLTVLAGVLLAAGLVLVVPGARRKARATVA